MHPLQWFLDREGSYILRGNTEVFIANKEVAEKLFNMQSEEYQFTAKLVIHRQPPEPCESCSA